MNNRKSFIKDEKGQAGGMVFFVLAILVFGLYIVALGPLMDKFTEVHNELSEEYPTSEARQKATNYQIFVWDAFPIILILMLVVWGIKNSIRHKGGQV